jgi:uncharacterized protein
MTDIHEKQRISQLLDLYGALLTDRQRDFIDLHFNEDLSYGEIAETEGISRQAVHDTIQHGRKAILHYEDHLQLLAKRNCDAQAINVSAIVKEIDEISFFLQDDIIYNVNPVRKKLKRIKQLLTQEPETS